MPKLSVEEFGAQLLTTGDLDPIYIALNNCALDNTTRNKWLTAYCAFYNAGFACWAAEKNSSHFWACLLEAADNSIPTPFGSRWPRGSERRHFRGKQATLAIMDWNKKYDSSPEHMMEAIAGEKINFHEIMKRAREHRSVGSWMGFKLVDLVDACMEGNVDQSDVMLFMYETPRKSLLRLWREKLNLPETAMPKDENQTIIGMVEHYKEIFKDFKVPHKPYKNIDMFCLETIFCKHQSHLNGHYPLFNDIDEVTEGIHPWIPYSHFAKLFMDCVPKRII